jgi:hypothetical protein
LSFETEPPKAEDRIFILNKSLCMCKVLLIGFFLLLPVTVVLAQERTVSGRVTASEDGAELPGVNVVVKGTTAGTITDNDGHYSVTVKRSGSVLVFSSVGYTAVERTVGSSSVIDIQLGDDVKQLSDIVVSGPSAGFEGDMTRRCGG